MPRPLYVSGPPARDEVVAGLLDGASASAVATVAVGEAATRGARLRFLQVLPAGLGAAAHTRAASALFRVAMTALAGAAVMPVTFETIVGTAPQMLVERSRGAVLLVVRADGPESDLRVAAYCVEHCAFDVLVVAEALPSTVVVGAGSRR